MRPVERADILSTPDFVAGRRRFEAEVLRGKAVRRLELGPLISIFFENRLSVWWQVQEMCRVERIVSEEAIAHELLTYNELLPGPTTLSATLMVEVDEPASRAAWLQRLVGLHQHVFLEIGGQPRVPVTFDAAQFEPTRISAVQFVRAELGQVGRLAFQDFQNSVALVCDHPEYLVRTAFLPSVRGALVEDMLGGGALPTRP